MASQLTLAVAGGRKTQAIADRCAAMRPDRRAVVLTYTQANQQEMKARLDHYAGDHLNIEVLGWFTFLLRHIVKPFLPFKFHGKRVAGFNFDGRPGRFATGFARFFDSHDCAYACELGRLAHELIGVSQGAALRRIECLFQEMLIDEVQDLSAHDLEILDVLLQSKIDVWMVGDARQAVLATNPRSSKNKAFGGAKILAWFRAREQSGTIKITESSTTWRCRREISSFSDGIFDASWGLTATSSMNDVLTAHDGVFLVKPEHANEYVKRFSPQCLRHSASCGKEYDFVYMNFKLAKGLTRERILIVPTDGIRDFIKKGKYLDPGPAAVFYVAATRAKQSVAIIIADGGASKLPFWEP